MNKASSSFLVLAFATLLVSVNSFAQRVPGQPQRPKPPVVVTPIPNVPTLPPVVIGRDEVVTEDVRLTLSRLQILRLSQILRLRPQEERELEVVSLSILAQNIRGRADLTVQSFGRPLTPPERVRPQLAQISLHLPQATQLEGLELVATEEVLIESVTLTVRRNRIPGPGIPELPVRPNQLLTLQVHQQIRGAGQIALRQLVQEQHRASLLGAEIERIIVQGQSLSGRPATIQVELNNRIVATETLSAGQIRKPIPLRLSEEVRGNLRLHISGEVVIQEVLVRVGQVRGGGLNRPLPQRIQVRQEVSSARPLELSHLLPHETRLVTALSVEASTRHVQAELALLSLRGELLGSVLVTQIPMRHSRIQLLRAASLRDLRLSSWAPVMIESLELELAPGF